MVRLTALLVVAATLVVGTLANIYDAQKKEADLKHFGQLRLAIPKDFQKQWKDVLAKSSAAMDSAHKAEVTKYSGNKAVLNALELFKKTLSLRRSVGTGFTTDFVNAADKFAGKALDFLVDQVKAKEADATKDTASQHIRAQRLSLMRESSDKLSEIMRDSRNQLVEALKQGAQKATSAQDKAAIKEVAERLLLELVQVQTENDKTLRVVQFNALNNLGVEGQAIVNKHAVEVLASSL